MSPDNWKEDRREAITINSNATETLDELIAIGKAQRAVRLLMTLNFWSPVLRVHFGDSTNSPQSIELYASFILYRDQIEPIVREYRTDLSDTESYLVAINNHHLYLEADRKECGLEELVDEKFIQSSQQDTFLKGILSILSEKATGERTVALLDFRNLLPPYSLEALRMPTISEAYLSQRPVKSKIASLFKEWLLNLEGKIKPILALKKERQESYSPHDLLDTIAQLIDIFPSEYQPAIGHACVNRALNSKKFCGLLFSLSRDALLLRLPSSNASGSFLPKYARSFNSFWNDLETKPNFDRMISTINYFMSELILMQHRDTYIETDPAIRAIYRVLPRQFGLSAITDDMWRIRRRHEENSRSRCLAEMRHFSSDPQESLDVLRILDHMQFPYDGDPASEGFFLGLVTLSARLNSSAQRFKGLNRAVPQIAGPIAQALYPDKMLYPFGLDKKSGIESGDPTDYTKSVLFSRLAERGLHFSKKALSIAKGITALDHESHVKIPHDRIQLSINWSFGEYLCKKYKRELDRYARNMYQKEGEKYVFNTEYRSQIQGVDSLVYHTGRFLYEISQAYDRNENRPTGVIRSGDIDLTIEYAKYILERHVPHWDSLQPCHQEDIRKSLVDFMFRAFPVGSPCTSERFKKPSTFTPAANRNLSASKIVGQQNFRTKRKADDTAAQMNKKKRVKVRGEKKRESADPGSLRKKKRNCLFLP